jgi:dynein heavy chain
VRTNLHVVLAMSPIGDGFRNRCRMFPALVNNTTIDWFHEWPSDALQEVAYRFLEDIRIGECVLSRAAQRTVQGVLVVCCGGGRVLLIAAH